MKILRRARARSKFSEKFAPFIRASKFSHSFFKFQTRKFSAQTFTSRTYCAALKNAFVLAESKTCALLSSLAPQKSLAGLLLPPPPPRGLLLLVFSPTFAATFAARQHKYAKKGWKKRSSSSSNGSSELLVLATRGLLTCICLLDGGHEHRAAGSLRGVAATSSPSSFRLRATTGPP